VKPIHKRKEVIYDLADLYGWICERNPDAAERFLRAIDDTLHQISRHPGIGWERPWRNPKLSGMRSWRVEGFSNFLIFYREEAISIEIFGVLRGARHLARVLSRRQNSKPQDSSTSRQLQPSLREQVS